MLVMHLVDGEKEGGRNAGSDHLLKEKGSATVLSCVISQLNRVIYMNANNVFNVFEYGWWRSLYMRNIS
jgi:hypothetical protein